MSSRNRPPRPIARGRRSRRFIVIGATLAILAVAGAAAWWRPGGGEATGTPRLAVDRTEIDLGYFRFEAPAVATFVVTNTGDGPLRLEPSPPVKAVVGC